MSRYRYPSETLILILTLLGIAAALILTSLPTMCLSPLFVLLMVILAYSMNQSHHKDLMRSALHVTPQSAPALSAIVERCRQRLNAPPVQVYITKSRERNAYTFGLSQPNVIVLYSSLLNIMDEDELAFLIGHELGHVVFNHSWLNTVVGGMAGTPLPYGAAILLALAFRIWNRTCEYSADRAGLIACGRLDKSIQALVEIIAGDVNTASEVQSVLTTISQQAGSLENQLAEALSTHPLMAKRIQKLRQFAAQINYQ